MILTRRIRASAPALVGFTCASSATTGSSWKMGAAQVAGSNTTQFLQQKAVEVAQKQQLGLDERWKSGYPVLVAWVQVTRLPGLY